MCNNDFNIRDVIGDLSKERRIFTSEADFQLALAQAIAKKYTQAKVRLEYVPSFDSSIHIDILVLWKYGEGVKWIPIEVKYKTKPLKEYTDDDGCDYSLKEQGAKDIGCYLYLKDIERIESIMYKIGNVFKCGYTLMLTNDMSYTKAPRNHGGSHQNCTYAEFSIHQNNTVNSGVHKWAENSAVGKKNGYNKHINLSGSYKCDWC